MKESQIEKEIREYAESRDILLKKFTSPGWVKVPDRIGLTPFGVAIPVFFIEIKKPNGDIHPKQARVCRDLNMRGTPAIITDNLASAIVFMERVLAARVPSEVSAFYVKQDYIVLAEKN